MMSQGTRLYYTAPTNKIFEEVKQGAIKIWRTYDDTHGYASEKVGRIKDLENIRDNMMFILAMFDPSNQARLLGALSDEAAEAIHSRVESGKQGC